MKLLTYIYFQCNEANCDKSFRKQRMLEAHLKHYHKDRISTSPASSLVYSDNSSLISGNKIYIWD